MFRDSTRSPAVTQSSHFLSTYKMQQRPIGTHTAGQELRTFRKPLETLRHYYYNPRQYFLFLNVTDLLYISI